MSLIGETKLAILREIEQDTSHGYAIAESLDLSHGYVYTHLRELRDEGMIEVFDDSGGKKRYRLTQNGKSLLSAFGE